MAVDYYALLQVDPHATIDMIRRAYLRLARDHHPDSNRGDEAAGARFREILLAYETLRDPQRRAVYDCQRQRTLASRFSAMRDTTRNAGENRSRATGAADRWVVRQPSSQPRTPFHPRVAASPAEYSHYGATVGLVLLLTTATRMVMTLPDRRDRTDFGDQLRAQRTVAAAANQPFPEEFRRALRSVADASLKESGKAPAVVRSEVEWAGLDVLVKNDSSAVGRKQDVAAGFNDSPPRLARDPSAPLHEYHLRPPVPLPFFTAEMLGPMSASAWKPVRDGMVQISIDATVINSPFFANSHDGDAGRIPARIDLPAIDFSALGASPAWPWKPVMSLDLTAVLDGLDVRPPAPGSVNDYFAEQPYRISTP